jgi:pilus assembly protein CpaE
LAAAAAVSDEEMTMSKEPTNETEASTGENFGAAAYERPVPRISIEAFCEFPDTTAAFQRASADRRLSKAHVGLHPGGIQEAVNFFGRNQTANLLIV